MSIRQSPRISSPTSLPASGKDAPVVAAFRSVLNRAMAPPEPSAPPDYFSDLNLDQIVASVTAGADEYNLEPFFYAPQKDRAEIEYRQAAMRDMEDDRVLRCVRAFALEMKAMRERLAQSAKMYYKYQKEALFLDAAAVYRAAVDCLRDELGASDLKSEALSAFRDYLDAYVGSRSFAALSAQIDELKQGLASIRYCLRIRTGMLTVTKYDSEEDYGAAIARDFEKFRQGAAARHVFKFGDFPQMNHIEAGVLDRVALLHPEIFARLDEFFQQNASYMDEKIRAFDREAQFYISYLDYIAPLKKAGLPFCYPAIGRDKAIEAAETFDLALARKLLDEKSPVVRNVFYLRGKERIFIVSGPNQGGKTTFARMLGQLHHLAAIGCPVPGARARLFLFDNLLAHFEREENMVNLRGKLQDDLVRLRALLDRATPDSIVLLNEIFNSTTLRDALFLSAKILERIVALDALCVCVTFIHEPAGLSDKAVSMVSMVAPDDPARRTYKIERRRADGLAYALAIAERRRLTLAQLRERLAS